MTDFLDFFDLLDAGADVLGDTAELDDSSSSLNLESLNLEFGFDGTLVAGNEVFDNNQTRVSNLHSLLESGLSEGDACDSASESPLDLEMFGGSPPPWANARIAYLEDWDHDGVPNYADEHFGPGAHGLFGERIEDLDVDPKARSVVDIKVDPDSHEVLTDSNRDISSNGDSEGALGNEHAYSQHQDAIAHDNDILGSLIAGDPQSEADHWHLQEDQNSCAVACQKGILESLTNQSIPESELSELAECNGWYDPSCGTSPLDVGRLLEAYGVPLERGHDYTAMDLLDALGRGEKVIVGVDANEIWTPIKDSYGNPVEQPDTGHAVWVTGMEVTDDGRAFVCLNDPGTPDGRCKIVALEDFLNAWNDFGNFATITRINTGVAYA